MFIINYEQLLRDLETVRNWNPNLVVLDEAQRIKNWAARTAISVKGSILHTAWSSPARRWKTGSRSWLPLSEWVDEMALEPKWRLPALHAMRSDGRREITGVRNLDTLRQRLQPCMVRRIRQEVLDQLPPRTDIRVPIEMTPAQIEEHDALIRPIAAVMRIAEVGALTQAEFLRLMSLLTTQRIISNGLARSIRTRLAIGPRLCSRRERAQGPFRPQAPGVAPAGAPGRDQPGRARSSSSASGGGCFTWPTGLCPTSWPSASHRRVIHRRRKQRRRTQNIVEFHDDPAFSILFASDAGGVGLNLQRAANCVINLELPWNPAVLEQRIGRIYRLGQKQPIDVYNLVCEQGIESRIADLVGNKQAFFKGLFDGDSDTVKFDQSGSFLSRVRKLYDPATLAAAAAAGGSEEIEQTELADVGLDDEVADPFEELIEAGDEAQARWNLRPAYPPSRLLSPRLLPRTPARHHLLPSLRQTRASPERYPAWARSASFSHSLRSAASRTAAW